jgi:hypothetical protein
MQALFLHTHSVTSNGLVGVGGWHMAETIRW